MPTKRTTFSLIKVKSSNSLLRALLVCIPIYPYKYLTVDTYHPDTIYLRKHGYEDRWLFFEAKRGPRAKKFRNTALEEHGDKNGHKRLGYAATHTHTHTHTQRDCG